MNLRKGPLPALPVAEKKGFDTNVTPGASLKSVAESGVLAESLKRSREKWLYDTFPKFASKPGHGGKNDYMGNTDWHSYHERGTCDVDMGPHTFSNLLFYEYYKQGQGMPPAPANQHLTSANGLEPLGEGPLMSTQSQTQAAPTPAFVFDFSDINSLSTITLPTDPHERREYLRQVHNAIAYNAVNAAAVQRAAAREGKTLEDVLAMLRDMMDIPQMPFKLIIRFEELPSERLLIPQSPAVLEMLPNNDAKLTLILPFDEMVKPVAQTENPEEPPSPVKRRAVHLTIRNITPAIKDTLTRWIGGEDRMNDYRAQIDALKKDKPQRLYLGLHLGSNTILLQHIKAISQQYTMKTLKQSTAPAKPSRAKKAATKKNDNPQSAAPSTFVNVLPTNTTYVQVNPASAQPTPTPALNSSASTAGLSVPPMAPPTAAVSSPNQYSPSLYISSMISDSYPAYPSPPPPPPPFSSSTTTFPANPNYPSPPNSYAPVLSHYASTSAIYSTSTTTPYGSRGYLPPSPPLLTSSHYPFAHYYPAHSPYPPRTESPKRQVPVTPTYVPTVGTVMQCKVCGATEVPLYFGGQYCRPCQDKRLGEIRNSEAKKTAELDAKTTPASVNETRHSPYPVSRTLSSPTSFKARSRPRHPTQTSFPIPPSSRFSLTTPARFDDPPDSGHDK